MKKYPPGITFTKDEELLYSSRTDRQKQLNELYTKAYETRYSGRSEDQERWKRMQTEFDLQWENSVECGRWRLWKELNKGIR